MRREHRRNKAQARRRVTGEKPLYVSDLNGKWGTDVAFIANMLKKEKSQDSTDSRMTVWPVGETNSKCGEAKKLGPDEFGHDSDVASDWSRGEGVIIPEEFDLEVLKTRLCGSEVEHGFEQRDLRLKPVAPMPASTLRRKASTIDDQSR